MFLALKVMSLVHVIHPFKSSQHLTHKQKVTMSSKTWNIYICMKAEYYIFNAENKNQLSIIMKMKMKRINQKETKKQQQENIKKKKKTNNVILGD
jgi:hypothetical protein